MSKYFSAKELLSPPIERAAFSDRQAYVCAELSKLAYFKFEGGHTADDLIAFVKTLFKDDERIGLLENKIKALLTVSPSSEQESKDALGEILQHADLNLVETFSVKGTQAFICTRKVKQSPDAPEKTMAFLVFRGTEPTDFRDIKTDVKAKLTDVQVDDMSIKMHSGYIEAFNLVHQDIKETLSKVPHNQLFITGHSLGGALAIVATRLLASDITGACYTFGAPPVGTENVSNKLKTPVYEIINETDIVPRLPDPFIVALLLGLLWVIRMLGKAVSVIGKMLVSGTWDENLESYLKSMIRYRHPGYVSYLVGSGAAAKLRYNINPFDRLKWWSKMMGKRLTGFRKMFSDHSIDRYIEKLIAHGQYRQ